MSEVILVKGAIFEHKIKGSKFIARIERADTVDSAVDIIKSAKKEHYKATHNCSAYIVGNNLYQNDDGEPSGTAGPPMLDVLKGSLIINAVAVVTRYFGGTLLGTGGLVRAYSSSVSDALKLCKLSVLNSGILITIRVDFKDLSVVNYIISSYKIHSLDIEYTDYVTMKLVSPTEVYTSFEAELIERTASRVRIISKEGVNYLNQDNNITIES